jgi:hypothetical protein
MWHEKWFGKGQCVLFVEKIHMPDGRTVKKVVANDKPTIRYHVTKPEFWDEHKHPELAYEVDKCDEYESELENLYKDIAGLTDQMSYYNTLGQLNSEMFDRWLEICRERNISIPMME